MNYGQRTFKSTSCKIGRCVQVPVEMRSNLVELTGLYTPVTERQQGHATELMHTVCREADEAHKTILIHVQPYGDMDLGRSQLEDWYAKTFGFATIQVEPLLMARMPWSTPRALSPLAAAAAEATH